MNCENRREMLQELRAVPHLPIKSLSHVHWSKKLGDFVFIFFAKSSKFIWSIHWTKIFDKLKPTLSWVCRAFSYLQSQSRVGINIIIQQHILFHIKALSYSEMVEQRALLHKQTEVHKCNISIVKGVQYTGLTKVELFKLQSGLEWLFAFEMF